MDDRLYRSQDDRVIAGVAGGLAEHWGADPSIVRILWALLAIFTGGLALLVYVIMAIVVPEEDEVFPNGRPAVPLGPVSPDGTAGSPDGMTGSPEGATAPMATRPITRYEARRARRAARRASRQGRDGRDGRVGVAVGGIFFIVLGSWLLLREWLPGIDFDWFWPAILIGIGVLIVVMSLGRQPEEPGKAP